MEFKVTVALQNLHCITPTDPSGEDEPYLWVFYVKLDGSAVRQRTEQATRLTATVTVESGPGRPGNLGVSGLVSGGNVPVTPAVGRYDGYLRPITIDMEGTTRKARVYIPGTILTVVLLADEEAVPRDATETAFNDVKGFVQNRLNDLLNDLDLGPIMISAFLSNDPVGTAQGQLRAQLNTIQQTLVTEATKVGTQSATLAVLGSGDWWNPIDITKQIAAGLDQDEPIGSATLMPSEGTIISASLAEQFSPALRQSASGLGGAWYTISGYASGELRFFPGDIRVGLSGPPRRKRIKREITKIKKGRRCLKAGTRIDATRVGFTEEHTVRVNYPFLRYRYFLDDVELVANPSVDGQPGVIQVSKAVSFPEFDEEQFYLIGTRQETRTITIKHERWADGEAPQLEILYLSNDSNDGCYEVMLKIEGVLPNGHTIPVATTGIEITGQVLEIANKELERYIACIAAYLKSLDLKVKPRIPEQWRTPEIKWQRLNTAVERLEALSEVRPIDRATIDLARIQIAKKLGLG